MGFWLWVAKQCIKKDNPRYGEKRRQVIFDAEYSKVWDPDVKTGYGNREYFTIELSKWLKERNDRVELDDLVGYLHDEHFYLIRKKPKAKMGNTSR